MRNAQSLFTSFPERLRALMSWRSAISFVLIYAAALLTAALVRYGGLIASSLALGEEATAWKAALAAVRDIVPEAHAAAWLLGMALVVINVMLLFNYIRRIRDILPLMVGAGAGFGATIAFMLGFACLSCSVVVAVFLAAGVSAGALPTLLSVGGEALLWGGMAVLGLLTALLFKKTTDPFVC